MNKPPLLINDSIYKNKKTSKSKPPIDRTASRCYMLNEATLGINCKGFPKSMLINDVINFFSVYGEIDALGYEPEKKSCKVIYYDIRSSVAAFIALQKYSFDEKHVFTISFIDMNYFSQVEKTSFILLRLINNNNNNKFPSIEEVEQFARSYGDFHYVEPTTFGGFIIYFYDSRQCSQCLGNQNIEFTNNSRYSILPYYNCLNKFCDSKLNKEEGIFIEVPTINVEKIENNLKDSLKNLEVQIYQPAPIQHSNFHSKLLMTLFTKYSSSNS